MRRRSACLPESVWRVRSQKASQKADMKFDTYQTDGFHDEMFDENGVARPEASLLLETIQSLDEGQLERCQRAAERLLLQLGITFNVYGDSSGTERIFPFDLIPRIVRAEEWEWIERGLKQRIHALNAFINDITTTRRSSRTRSSPRKSLVPPPFTARNAWASTRRAEYGATSVARIWSATATAKSMCWRTISGYHLGSPMCLKIGI